MVAVAEKRRSRCVVSVNRKSHCRHSRQTNQTEQKQPFHLTFLFSEREILLPEKTNKNSNQRDEHLARSGVPLPDFDTKLKSEIIDCEVERNNKYVSEQLPVPLKRRAGKSDMPVKPETGE